jgi:hypothetical protein
MTLTIDDASMTSGASPHAAHRVPGRDHEWEVSWLPGRALDRNAAITAMVIADLAAEESLSEAHRLWPFVEGWAAELGLTAGEAAAAVKEPINK